MKKSIASILTLAVAGLLMIYSATRTVDLLSKTLPPGQEALAFLALAAFDGGLIAWLLTFMFAAEGAWQRGISGMMVVVSLIGVVVGFGADQVLGAASGGMINKEVTGENFGLIVVLATVAIIGLNIAAVTFFHLMSLDNQRRMQEESFNDKIEAAAFSKSNESIDTLAAQLAIHMNNSTMARLEAKYSNRIAAEMTRAGLALPAAMQVVEQPPNEQPEPSKLEAIKRRLEGIARVEEKPMATMAADAPAPKVMEQ